MKERSSLTPEELGEGLYYGILHLAGEHAPALRAVFQEPRDRLPERLDDALAEEMVVLGLLLMSFHLLGSPLEEPLPHRAMERLLITALEQAPVKEDIERILLAEAVHEGMEAYRLAMIRWIEEEKDGEIGRVFLERLPVQRPTRREIRMTELYLLQYSEVLWTWLDTILQTYTINAGESSHD